ncbi:hypothetical protein [Rossellomorea sp. BNER]
MPWKIAKEKMTVRKILYSAVKNRKGENGGTKGAQWCRENLQK